MVAASTGGVCGHTKLSDDVAHDTPSQPRTRSTSPPSNVPAQSTTSTLSGPANTASGSCWNKAMNSLLPSTSVPSGRRHGHGRSTRTSGWDTQLGWRLWHTAFEARLQASQCDAALAASLRTPAGLASISHLPAPLGCETPVREAIAVHRHVLMWLAWERSENSASACATSHFVVSC